MKKNHWKSLTAGILLFAMLLTSCGTVTPPETEPETDSPAQSDTPAAETESAVESVTETEPVTEAVTEAETEVPTEAATETEPATEADTEVETEENPVSEEDVFTQILDRFAYIDFGDGETATNVNQRQLIMDVVSNSRKWQKKVDRSCKTDPFGLNYQVTSSNMSTLYANICAMARGYATPGSMDYKDPELLDDIIYCLDFMYDKYYGGTRSKLPSGSNWHDSYINAPSSLTRILLALRDDLTMEQIAHYTDYMDTLIYEPSMTSGNMIDMAFSTIISAALQKQGTRLQRAVNKLTQNVFVYTTKKDGVYRDGSYIMHDNVPYTTGYGGSLIGLLSHIMYAVDGTKYAFGEKQKNMQVDWLFDVFAPVMWRGAAMSAVSGRIIWSDSHESSRSVSIIRGMARMIEYAPEERVPEIQSLLKYYLNANSYQWETGDLISTADFVAKLEADDSIVALEEKDSAKVFPYMARLTTHRVGYASMLSMCSPTIARYEGFTSGNMNTTGWYTGAGMLYVYADSTMQFDQAYHRNVNRYRLPGTTVDTRPRDPKETTDTYNRSAFVGGVQMDVYAVAGFAYDNKNRDFQSDLTANKSYFFFDDEYVMVGSAIDSTKDNGVITTVENQRINGDLYKLYLNDEEKAISGRHKEYEVQYAWLDGYGAIVFPDEQTLMAGTVKSGKYQFSEIYFNHGKNPTADTYSYIILPLADRATGKAYYEAPEAEILAKTDKVHAVRENTLGITGVVFWGAAEWNGITANFACTMMTKETETGLELAVSDPTMRLSGKKTIVLDGVYTLVDGSDKVSVENDGAKTTITVDLTNSEGQSILMTLAK